MGYRVIYSDEIEHGLFNWTKKAHKYIKRERGSNGQWVYTYTTDKKEATKLTKTDIWRANNQLKDVRATYNVSSVKDKSSYNENSKLSQQNRDKVNKINSLLSEGNKVKSTYQALKKTTSIKKANEKNIDENVSKLKAELKDTEEKSRIYTGKAAAAKRNASNTEFQYNLASQKYDDIVAQYEKQQKSLINRIKNLLKIK